MRDDHHTYNKQRLSIMSVARFTAFVEALVGETVSAERIQRLALELFELVPNVEEHRGDTNNQKAALILDLARQHLKGLVGAGSDIRQTANSFESIRAARIAAMQDL